MKLLRRARAILVLLAVFLWDLVVASLGVARIVLAPRVQTTPAIIIVPVSVRQPWAIALFAYFTSLTPGSTCLHVSGDRTRLFVHTLQSQDPVTTAHRFERLYERWIAEIAS